MFDETTAESFRKFVAEGPTPSPSSSDPPLPSYTDEDPSTLHDAHTELLAVVDALRKAYPPEEPLWDPASPEAPIRTIEPRRSERQLEALERLSRLLALPGAPLLPLQFEVLFRQLVHVLLVVRTSSDAAAINHPLIGYSSCTHRLLIMHSSAINQALIGC